MRWRSLCNIVNFLFFYEWKAGRYYFVIKYYNISSLLEVSIWIINYRNAVSWIHVWVHSIRAERVTWQFWFLYIAVLIKVRFIKMPWSSVTWFSNETKPVSISDWVTIAWVCMNYEFLQYWGHYEELVTCRLQYFYGLKYV